MVGIVDSSS